jgi:hypothetical protein
MQSNLLTAALIVFCMYVIFRDDINPVLQERFGKKPVKRKYVCDDEDYYNEQAFRERQQKPELN